MTRESFNVHVPRFDRAKGQVAHDLAILTLNKTLSGKKETETVYRMYMELLEEFSTMIDAETRYETPSRK